MAVNQSKDVDGFHPEILGKMVLLDTYEVHYFMEF
jgi:5,10-methylene-tetrahydrofolate dehydrogenase/methenyl tetrahydrofolate cyclohydrolase